jgi:hypothetical protein
MKVETLAFYISGYLPRWNTMWTCLGFIHNMVMIGLSVQFDFSKYQLNRVLKFWPNLTKNNKFSWIYTRKKGFQNFPNFIIKKWPDFTRKITQVKLLCFGWVYENNFTVLSVRRPHYMML